MKHIIWLALLMLMALAGHSYRFLCNGIYANGVVRNDTCGLCDIEYAARWENPNLAVMVDDSVLPKGISQSDWHYAVQKSFAAWESVSGSDLRFFQINGQPLRQFGTNENLHEIYWVTDMKEWRKLVGGGEFGTFGATLPRYACGGDLGNKRVIFDADLILNGLMIKDKPLINWQIDCQDEDCISVQTTLVHELGHFFGLDHPCVMCSDSIMSARAGFDLTYPVFDDMEGLRALYPSNNKGGFGYPCKVDNDCQSNNICVNDNQNKYCSKACENDGNCDSGSICANIQNQQVCAFINAENGQGRKEGDNCLRVACVEPLVCAGADEPFFYCFLPCQTNDDCSARQECIKIKGDASICVGIRDKGERCTHRELCENNLYCVFDNAYAGFCRAECTSIDTAGTGCPSQETCQIIEGVELCIPETTVLDLDDLADGFGQKPNAHFEPSMNNDKGSNQFGCQTTALNSMSYFFVAMVLLLRLIKRLKLVQK